jgi:hypothetical protein
MAGNDELRNALKILSRLIFRPLRRAGSEGLKMKCAVGEDVAAITACVAETVLQENWLDGVFEKYRNREAGPEHFRRASVAIRPGRRPALRKAAVVSANAPARSVRFVVLPMGN